MGNFNGRHPTQDDGRRPITISRPTKLCHEEFVYQSMLLATGGVPTVPNSKAYIPIKQSPNYL